MFFRNRATLYGISIVNLAGNGITTDNQVLVGNETTNFDAFKGNFLTGGSGHFIYGNNIRGVVQPAGTEELPDTTYCRSVFAGTNPLIGLPESLKAGTNAAAQRVMLSQLLTVCSNDTAPAPSTDGIEPTFGESWVQHVFPNPFSETITIDLSADKLTQLRLRMSNVDGKTIQERVSMIPPGKHRIVWEIEPDLPGGLYILEIISGEERFVKKLVNHL
ncbi:MAG: T9SS type A sorting domain-containing protein [Bacteroidia bacterium]